MKWLVAVVFCACGMQVGPFVAPNAPFCSSDVDCPDGTHCAFPGVNTRARCVAGDSNFTDYPDAKRKRDAGTD